MKACVQPALALLLLLAHAKPAAAHADYDRVMTTLTDARGETYTIVYHYTDGIIGSDPVRLEVRDANGNTVAKTRYVRDVVLHRAADGTAYAFAVDQDHIFWRGWTIEAGQLVEAPVTPRTVGLALLAHLGAHWLGYALSAALTASGILLYVRRARTKRTWLVEPPSLLYCAVLWMSLVLLHGNQSILIVAPLVLAATLPVILWTRRRPEGKLQGSGS